jgi:hypothetical protein
VIYNLAIHIDFQHCLQTYFIRENTVISLTFAISTEKQVSLNYPKGKILHQGKKEGITQTLVSTTEVHNTITGQM